MWHDAVTRIPVHCYGDWHGQWHLSGNTPDLDLQPLADLSQATIATRIEIADGKAAVIREIDGGLEIHSITLHAVMTTDLRLNEPLYVT